MIKKILLTFLIAFSILISCKENKAELNNNLTVEYYENNPKQIFRKRLSLKDYDSIYYYYNDGKLFKKGKQYAENQKFGNWNLYDREQNLREIREYFTIDSTSRLNRAWNLNKKGDTIAWRREDSIYKQKEFINDTIHFRHTIYDIIYFNKDTIKLNEPIIGYADINSSVIRKDTSNARVFLARQGANFNRTFSNKDKVSLITFNDLTKDTVNQKWFPGYEKNKLVAFGYWFDSIGTYNIRGYYQQHSYGPFKHEEIYTKTLAETGKELDSITGGEIYFEKKVVVIDSL
jgi:hypothetical protein